MIDKKKAWDHILNPVYFPLLTAFPIGGWLLFKSPPITGVEITLHIITFLFLVFSGAVETNSEEGKQRIFGYIYLLSALIFGGISLFRWLI
jgi:hypothetical protein